MINIIGIANYIMLTEAKIAKYQVMIQRARNKANIKDLRAAQFLDLK